MRLLHTSDWHLGRTFHGHSTDAHLEQVLDALAAAVKDRGVDAVIVAGDVFDSSTPKAEAFAMLNRVVAAVRSVGAQVVLTSGNHDGPARLGHMADFAAFGGVHVRTDLARLADPVLLTDENGQVAIYALPYIHPEFLRAAYGDFGGSTHAQALSFAMDLVRADSEARRADAPGLRTVVASHCFAAGVEATTEDSGRSEERDITRGGLNIVPLSVFDGMDYVALGHIHGRQTLTERVRYSGAPLRFSFGERASAKGAWLVDLDAHGLERVEWLELPTPRAAVRLQGTLEALLADGAHPEAVDCWVEAVLTDDQLPREAMRRLQTRYPFAVTLSHRPAGRHDHGDATYATRVEGRSDAQIVDEFLTFVRNGQGPTEAERALLHDAFQALEVKEASR
ncbi:exonuclease SbcCD subunit D C-terminal domain-containing protein [Demequina capsici]|uniref:Nuclease SbcCD subunit D n=1 Tax=Demequina capsici TaxID=3075620 RepID=A0AA96FBH9_9MICO|nr:exonuclease SbcCD subunit D C-terminal domain-containing protein [Demequina sp. PMTSA13]WNM26372.1 exonuclease SbcCD subunit D C-terminal domain-containing protein [Demequina sp. PMTSA13]